MPSNTTDRVPGLKANPRSSHPFKLQKPTKPQKPRKWSPKSCTPTTQSSCGCPGHEGKSFHFNPKKSVSDTFELSSPSTTSTTWDASSESSDCASPVSRVIGFVDARLTGFKGDERMLNLMAAAREVLQKHNPYLLHGYRMCGTPSGCLSSLFQLHNETLNIWTHMLPAIWFLYLCIRYVFVDIPAGVPSAWVFLISSLASSILFVSSTLYHTFRCMSPAALWGWLRVDYCGISTQIIGSTLPTLHLSFMCMVVLRNVYVTICSVMLALALLIASGLLPSKVQNKCCKMCGTDDWSVLSMYTLAVSVALAGLPFVQWAITTTAVELISFGPPLVLALTFYGGGFVLFTQMVPERFGYSWFNGALNSHAIWHACVACAALVTHNATVRYATWRVENPCAISAP